MCSAIVNLRVETDGIDRAQPFFARRAKGTLADEAAKVGHRRKNEVASFAFHEKRAGNVVFAMHGGAHDRRSGVFVAVRDARPGTIVPEEI